MILLPAALASLLALLIPLAIHLARRSEATPIDFAALQWLRPKPRPKSRLRFDEWPLLIVRLLLLALIALWLARPVLPNSTDLTPVVAALPGVDAGEAAKGTRNIWLAPGFPPAEEPQPTCLATPRPPAGEARDGVAGPGEGILASKLGNTLRDAGARVASPAGVGGNACPALASFIRQLDSELPAGVPLTLIIPEILSGVDAERPRLSRAVIWKIAPGAMPAITETPSKPLTFTLRGPPSRPLGAAIAALDSPGKPANLDTPAPDDPLPAPPRIVIWLTPGPLPPLVRDWITAGGTALVTAATPAEPGTAIIPWRDSSGAPLVTAHSVGAGRLFRFTRALTPAVVPALLEPDFPAKFAALFTPPAPEPSRVAARDIAPTTGAAPWPQPARDLQPLLAMLIAALFIAERWLATSRRRAATP